MNILVCVKQVPDTTEIKINPVTNTLVRTGVPAIVNPFDKHAVEAAVQLKEKHGGTVTVISMGPEQAKLALKECLSVGADRAVLVSDKRFGGSDTYATSYILSSAIQHLGTYDLIICGKQAIDGDTGQVGPAIAEHLGLTQLTYVTELDICEEQKIVVKREIDEGYELVEAKLPAVCTVVRSINNPRLATIKSKLAANKAEIEVLTFADMPEIDKAKIGLKGSPTKVKRSFTPEKRGTGIVINENHGDVAVRILAAKLIEAKLI
ncbi:MULTISPECIES: electron transfer flavoprotein subunit beta/FixA family protein [Bacillus]|uniref:electron transfer flavoprotein subunit beta/FixA family protein n=1 Tax=Bacillus TaxID=1386 RepID=UPI0002DED194|nr:MULTISPECIES: electron transfer flavoprotein subunit beta/FixA family protein [Bacillus]